MVFTDALSAETALPPRARAIETGPVSAETTVADILRKRILDGRLKVGSRLRQADIAAELGVSTTPVREALRTLVADGLVEIDTNRGAVIRELGREELAEVLELQLLVETASLRISIPQMTAEVLGRAEQLHELMVRSDDPVEWATLNRDFHIVLSIPSGRRRTRRMLRELLNISTIQLREDIAEWQGRREVGEADHAQLLEAARSGDASGAVRLIALHTQPAVDHLREQLAGGV